MTGPAPGYGRDDEPLARILARRLGRALRRDVGTPWFGRLLALQATGAAGDALIALALAGSLFFSVPEATARGRVALYLALTMAPFAVVSPLLARLLDRYQGSERWAMLVSAAGRGACAWLLATRLDTLYLFPLAFAVLVLSRAALIARGALLPEVLPPGRRLVSANASLSRVTAISGIVAGAPGLLLVHWPGPGTELLFAAAVYLVGAAAALRLPSARGRRSDTEVRALRVRISSADIRRATIAVGTVRLLVGFLVFHLAFALRRADVGTLSLGLLIGSAALGSLGGAVVAPRLRRRLRESGIIVTSLAGAGIAGVLVGLAFGLTTAAVLVFVFGVASGAAKVAFDSTVQQEVPEGARGWAFARFEALFQLVWVVGAAIPLIVPVPAGAGVFAVGVAALAAGVYYVGGRRMRAAGGKVARAGGTQER